MTVGELEVIVTARLDKLDAALAEGKTKAKAGGTEMGKALTEGFGLAVGNMTFAGVIEGVKKLVEGMVGGNAEMERYTTQFGVLLGNVTEAKKRMQELEEFAAHTPFQLPELAQASKELQVMGGTALATGNSLKLVGDMAAASGAGFETVAMHVGRLYSELAGGREFGRSAMQLQMLGLMSGETRNKMEDLAKHGAKASEVWKVFTDASGRFSGMMQKQSQTLEGLTTTLKDEWVKTLREVGKPLFDEVKKSVKGMIDALGDPGQKESIQNLLKIAVALTGIAVAAGGVLMAFKAWSIIAGIVREATVALAAFAGVEGEAAVGMGILRASTMAFGASLKVAFGPVGLAMAAIAAALYLVKKSFDALEDSKTRAFKEAAARLAADMQGATAMRTRAIETENLYNQIETLSAKTRLSTEESSKLHIAMNRLSEVAPNLITGYDAEGRAVGVLAGQYNALQKAVEDATLAQRHAALENAAAPISDAKSRLLKAQADLQSFKDFEDRQKRVRPLTSNDAEALRGYVEAVRNAEGEVNAIHNRMRESWASGLLPDATKDKSEDNLKKLMDNLDKTIMGKNKEAKGTLSDSVKAWKTEIKAAAKEFDLHVSSENRPGAHTATGKLSLHAKGLALDFAGDKAKMAEFYDFVKTTYAGKIRELIYSPKGEVYHGQDIMPDHMNKAIKAQHYSHVHVALTEAIGPDALQEYKDATKTTDDLKDKLADLRQTIRMGGDDSEEAGLKYKLLTGELTGADAVIARQILSWSKHRDAVVAAREAQAQLTQAIQEQHMELAKLHAEQVKNPLDKERDTQSLDIFKKHFAELTDPANRAKITQLAKDALTFKGEKDGAEKIEATRQAVKNLVASLQEEIDMHGKQTKAAQVAYELATEQYKGMDKAMRDQIINKAKQIDQLDAEDVRQKKLLEYTEKWKKFWDEIKHKIDEAKTQALDRFNSAMEDLNARMAEARGGAEAMRVKFSDLAKQYGGGAEGATRAKQYLDSLMDVQKAEQFKQQLQDIGKVLEDHIMKSLDNLYTHGFRNFFQQVAMDFRSMVADMVKQWAEAQARMAIQRGISQLIGVAMPDGGGGYQPGQGLGAGRDAVGGPILRNRPYIVGENGPEMIVPQQDAHVMTSAQTSKALGGQTVVHNWHITTPNPGAFIESQSQIEARMGAASLRQIRRTR